jgi:NodT family efflux transporter outer membrane factor (OMF) lipoprotein
MIDCKVVSRTRKSILSRLCMAAFFCLMSCTVGPDFVRPQSPAVDHYTTGPEPAATIPADGQSQRFEPGAKITADWWRLFNSSKLDAAIKEAVANNQNLKAAQASLRQSQEELSAGYGIFYPQIDAGFDATRQKFSQRRFGGTSASKIFNLYTLTSTVSYALDIFGGERRAVESLKAQVDYQRYLVAGTYLALTGNIVNAIIARAAYDAQIKATEQIVALEKEQLSITEIQARAGIIPYVNVLSLQTQIAATEATLWPLRQRLSQTEHLLATLTGHLPAEWTPPQIDLKDITLPVDLPVSLPSELVRQRPDILAAEAELHSASADIGVATAALFPSFTLNGSYGWNSTHIKDLIKDTSSIWNIGANIAAPLFHGGTLSAKRQAAIEVYNQSLANYRQTVLSSFAQVADNLRAIEHDAGTLQAESQALIAAEEALKLIHANYKSGLANYLQVLIANNQYHQAKIAYIQAQAQRLQDTVALFVALGGGWWDAKEDVSGKIKD